MKRTTGRFSVAVVAILVLGVVWARPRWLPGWAQIDLDRIAAWVHRPTPATAEKPDDDDEKEPGVAANSEREQIVRLASPQLVRRLGFETTAVAKERHAHRLSGNAETAYDGRHMAEILSRVSGVLREVHADLGQFVRQGDVLAVVESAQVGSAKVQFHTSREAVTLAQATYDRTVRLTMEKAAPGKTELENRTALKQAKASLMDAEQKLRSLGFSNAEVGRIAKATDTSNLLEIVAPIAGTITAWDATPGEAVEPTTQLFALADTRKMWLWVDVYESDIASVAVGQPVTFTISGTETPVFSGRVTSMGTEVNPTTRTTRVRAELENPDGRLRANQFGRASIQVEPEHEALVVPVAAVQDDGRSERVFVPLADGVSFRPQAVVTRPMDRPDAVEVVRGLDPGQRVVTTGAFLLQSELHKDAIAEDVD
jgi:cobalt-zinc-cadmium efflux system membrane fusion protein